MNTFYISPAWKFLGLFILNLFGLTFLRIMFSIWNNIEVIPTLQTIFVPACIGALVAVPIRIKIFSLEDGCLIFYLFRKSKQVKIQCDIQIFVKKKLFNLFSYVVATSSSGSVVNMPVFLSGNKEVLFSRLGIDHERDWLDLSSKKSLIIIFLACLLLSYLASS